jgi:hypothetical protein
MLSGRIKPKRYVVWSIDEEIDLDDPFQRKWYIKQVLTHGRMEDIMELDFEEVKRLLPELRLPKPIKELWEEYFASQEQRNNK